MAPSRRRDRTPTSATAREPVARNAHIPAGALGRLVPLADDAHAAWLDACRLRRLTGRGAARIRRVARTFADLDDHEHRHCRPRHARRLAPRGCLVSLDERSIAAATLASLLPGHAAAHAPDARRVRWSRRRPRSRARPDGSLISSAVRGARSTRARAAVERGGIVGRRVRRFEARATRVWIAGDAGYPIHDPLPDRPPVLLGEGDRPDAFEARRVAIVGTRTATPHGLADAASSGVPGRRRRHGRERARDRNRRRGARGRARRGRARGRCGCDRARCRRTRGAIARSYAQVKRAGLGGRRARLRRATPAGAVPAYATASLRRSPTSSSLSRRRRRAARDHGEVRGRVRPRPCSRCPAPAGTPPPRDAMRSSATAPRRCSIRATS